MLPNTMFSLTALAIAGPSFVAAETSAGAPRFICFDNETPDLHCYNGPNDTPQNVTVDDVSYIAKYLRAYGRQTREGRLFTQTAQDAPDCAEWTLYARKSALALAKHIDSSKNSSVLFEDIATTIDGGEKATDPQKQAAIIGCLSSGGTLGVLVNAANPVYSSAKYKANNFTPDGIMVKIVNNAS
ncbi:hypothetical protein V2A60_004708 [Cordyceps javanica]